jgi:hypothetical protein
MTMMIIVAAAVLWLALAATRKRVPMLIGSAILAFAWLAQIDLHQTAVVKASTMTPATASKGSCASIAAHMSEADVKGRLGEPDETRGDEETRGPGARMMIYRASRCAVHLFDGKVEFVE